MTAPVPRSRVALGAGVGLLLGLLLIAAAVVLLPAVSTSPSTIVGVSLLVTVGVLALALGLVAGVPLVWPRRATAVLSFILIGLAVVAAACAVFVVVVGDGFWKVAAVAPMWAATLAVRDSRRLRGVRALGPQEGDQPG